MNSHLLALAYLLIPERHNKEKITIIIEVVFLLSFDVNIAIVESHDGKDK